MSPRPIEVLRLGRVSYAEGTRLMEARVQARLQGEVPDALFLLEHEPVLTLGRGADANHVILPEAELARRGVQVVRTGRGGDVTYHGPGQIVGYPVVDLSGNRESVRAYIQELTRVMIDVAASYGVKAGFHGDMVGAWVAPNTPKARKLGAIGVRIGRWVTSHGFALNVEPDVLSAFRMIVPCGIADYGVTCLKAEAEGVGDVSEVLDRVEDVFLRRFGGGEAFRVER